jgi:hypothetical protein
MIHPKPMFQDERRQNLQKKRRRKKEKGKSLNKGKQEFPCSDLQQ